MIIITTNPDFDYYRDDGKPSGAAIYYGTNNPLVAFRLFMKEVFRDDVIDGLSDQQLADFEITPSIDARYSDRYLFSLIPTQEGEIIVEQVGAEVYIGAPLDDLFTGDDDNEG